MPAEPAVYPKSGRDTYPGWRNFHDLVSPHYFQFYSSEMQRGVRYQKKGSSLQVRRE